MTVLIGTLTASGGTDFFGDGDAFGPKYTAVASGNLDTMKIVIAASSFTGLKLAVYASDGGSGLEGTLLGTSSTITLNGAGTQTATMSPTIPIVSGTAYWLFTLTIGGTMNIANVVTGGAYRGKSLGAGVTTFPSPWTSPGTDSTNANGLAIQGEGTASATSSPRTFNAIPFMTGVL